MEFAEVMRQRTFRFSLGPVAFCRSLPDHWVAREIGRQLLRAGMGTAGNYWSACRGRSHKEFTAKLGIAVDEVDEAVLWLTLIVQTGIAQGPEAVDLVSEGREILAILSKSHCTARKNRRRESQLTKSPTRELTKSLTRELTKSTEGLP